MRGAGGEIPVHFITLTTAIYHWRDLANVLREYETCTTQCREGRRDPYEPGEEKVPEEKRRVQIYTGVVAWFCALKLELITRYVMESDDYFGVYEWGGGGIVHVHLLRWLSGRGRYDTIEASVPAQRRRRHGVDLASCHQDELAEWDICCPEKFPGGIWDNDCPVRRASEPLGTDDESDGGTCSDSVPSVGSDDPDAEATRGLEDDQQWKRMPDGVRVRDAKGLPVPEVVPDKDVEVLKGLVPLLEDAKWHPSALPLDVKRCLQTYNSRRVRRLRRWLLARLLGKTNQHDLHDGPPVEVQPVYGDDSASDSGDGDGEAENDILKAGASQESTDVKILTWNIDAARRGKSDCSFVLPEVLRQDVVCLQEVTPAAVEWFQQNLPKTYSVLTPEMRGHAWPQDTSSG